MKILLREISEIFLLMFSSMTLMVSRLTFKSFIHLEFIFVYGVSWCSSFIFWEEVSFFTRCRTYWFFLILLSGVILNKSNFLFHTWNPWDFFLRAAIIFPKYWQKKKNLNFFSWVSHDTVLRLLSILVPLKCSTTGKRGDWRVI